MEKVKGWFKTSSFYFWSVLVTWPAARGALSTPEIRGRIMGLFVSLMVALLALVVAGNVIPIQGFGLNMTSFGYWILATIALRFLGGLFYLPSKLYYGAKTQADKFTWNDVSIAIQTSDIQNSVYLKVSNNKPFDIHNANGVITYLQKGTDVIIADGPKRVLSWVKDTEDTSAPKKLSKKGDSASVRPLRLVTVKKGDNAGWIPVTDKATESDRAENIPLVIDVSYKIRMNLLGEVEGRKMDTYYREYWLTFTGSEVKIEEKK